jgi:hypothetical protein
MLHLLAMLSFNMMHGVGEDPLGEIKRMRGSDDIERRDLDLMREQRAVKESRETSRLFQSLESC